MNTSRRRFFLLAGGTVASLGGVRGFPLRAAETAVTPDLVRWRPEILPLVKLIETTARERCVEMLGGQLRKGVPFRELMAAAFLHALRHDGHHTVYLVHAALAMSHRLPPAERVLPLFWAVDVVKEHIGRFKEKPAPPLAGELPSGERAAAEFDGGMEAWEQERAERAIIAVARSQGVAAALQRLSYFAARDWSFIGHVPIAVSNAWRTLQVIGEAHAEPVLRYLVRELHARNEKQTQGQSCDTNRELVQQWFAKLPPDWADSRSDEKATLELLRIIRSGDWKRVSQWVARGLAERWVHAGDVWNATHLATAEFMVRFKLGNLRMANRALHSNTSGNALHHLFKVSEEARTRFFIALQAPAWAADFIKNESGRGMLRDISITALPEVEVPATADAAVEKIFGLLPPRPFRQEIEDRSGQDEAGQLAFAYARRYAQHEPFLATAHRLVTTKATINSHDVKFPIAIFENAGWVSPEWRPHLLAASVHFLHGTKMVDSDVVQRARVALKS
ncbi:MAG: hypothetical protein ABMA13_09470 [Chthoniobacteraceae bacterium]